MGWGHGCVYRDTVKAPKRKRHGSIFQNYSLLRALEQKNKITPASRRLQLKQRLQLISIRLQFKEDSVHNAEAISKNKASVPPLIRWAGSKRHSLEKIAAYWQSADYLYVEPFCGSAALFFHLRPQRAVLSDTNEDLVNFYSCVKSAPQNLHAHYNSLPIGRGEYYEIRNLFNEEKDAVTRASYFLYLNQHCFNGLYRTNMKGNFNVPFSGYKNKRTHDLDSIIKYGEYLSDTKIVSSDFQDVIEENSNNNSFVFVDPPYASHDGRIFTEYGATPFTLDDLHRLVRTLQRLDWLGGKFVLTYDSALLSLVDIPVSWSIASLRVRRNVSGFAAARKMVEEVVVSNIK